MSQVQNRWSGRKGKTGPIFSGVVYPIYQSVSLVSLILLTSMLSANLKNKAAAKMLTSRKREGAIKGMGTQGSTGTIKGI